MIVKDMNLQGKAEAMEFLQNQEKQAAAVMEHETMIKHNFEDAKLKELYSRATANIANARESNGRAESNIGLFEERLSEITRNRALATKDKMEALEKLIDVIAKYGEIEAALKLNDLQSIEFQQEDKENHEKADAKSTALANDFKMSIMGAGNQMQGQAPQQQNGQQMPLQQMMG
jgi:hypothetical protein